MSTDNLIFKPQEYADGEGGILVETTPATAGWQYLSFLARRMVPAETWTGNTGSQEAALVLVQGKIAVRAGDQRWELGERSGPFDQQPWAVYLPPNTAYEVTAIITSEVGWAQTAAEGRYPARLVTPDDVQPEQRGGGTSARTVFNIMPADFPAEHLIVVEALTPEGHWSSYPPHKHDVENLPHENQLEETYYYHIDPPQGFALQRVYTADNSRDVALVCEDGDLVLVPGGYHPVGAAAGYNCYYLNAQAGPSHNWLTQDDPAHSWIKTRPTPSK